MHKLTIHFDWSKDSPSSVATVLRVFGRLIGCYLYFAKSRKWYATFELPPLGKESIDVYSEQEARDWIIQKFAAWCREQQHLEFEEE